MPEDTPKRQLPPHMQRIVSERSRSIDDPQASGESRRHALERRRMALQFDIDQGELALDAENPWTHRIDLLTEALANVEAELAAKRTLEAQPYYPVPDLPIEHVVVSESEPYRVEFSIAGERFAWQERLDWIERGGLLAQPDFAKESGDVAGLIPEETPEELKDALARHLDGSVTAFAVALRDARLNDAPLPVASLADLARPCPVCGGWTEWGGHCNACAIRKVEEQALFAERQHLMKERATEAEERHRLGERLPLARRRMADLEREIASLED